MTPEEATPEVAHARAKRLSEASNAQLSLICGELTGRELRTIRAILGFILRDNEKFLEEGNKNWMMKTMKTDMKQALECIRELLARFPAPTCSEQEAAVETAKEILLKHDWYNSNNGISPLHV